MKYLCGIDESGITNNHAKLLNKFLNSNFINKKEKFALVTMILITKEEYLFFKSEFQKHKFKYFKTFNIKLHTSDLLNKRNNFYNYEIQELNSFFFEFLNLIENLNFKIFQTTIDKEEYYKKNRNISDDPYFLSLKYFFLKIRNINTNAPIDVFIEGRGYLLDINLLKNLYSWDIFKNSNININFVNKNYKNNYEIIELTDFVSYFLFINFLNIDSNYFKKVKVLSNENKETITMIKKIFLYKTKPNNFKKI